MPLIFDWLQRHGNIADQEMYRTFNCGIGMCVIVAAEDAEKTQQILQQAGETVWQIGKIENATAAEPEVIIKDEN